MKINLIITCCLMFLMFSARAQNASYSSSYYSDYDLKDADSYFDAVEMLQADGFSIAAEKYGTLAQDEMAYSYKTFYAGQDYKIVAISNDDDVTDVDIYVYDSDGSLYTKDNSDDAVAIANLHLYTTRQMKIVIKNTKSDTPYDPSICRFVIAYK